MAGRALYAKRKGTVESVIGIVKSVMRFRNSLDADVCLGWVAQSRNGLMADGNPP